MGTAIKVTTYKWPQFWWQYIYAGKLWSTRWGVEDGHPHYVRQMGRNMQMLIGWLMHWAAILGRVAEQVLVADVEGVNCAKLSWKDTLSQNMERYSQLWLSGDNKTALLNFVIVKAFFSQMREKFIWQSLIQGAISCDLVRRLHQVLSPSNCSLNPPWIFPTLSDEHNWAEIPTKISSIHIFFSQQIPFNFHRTIFEVTCSATV